jgi:hypothetical protein
MFLIPDLSTFAQNKHFETKPVASILSQVPAVVADIAETEAAVAFASDRSACS